jgi:hypothetical protein
MKLDALVVTAALLALGTVVTFTDWRSRRALVAYLLSVGATVLLPITARAPQSPVTFILLEATRALFRFALVVELAKRIFEPLPGARDRSARLVLVGLVATLGLIAWGLCVPVGPRSTFRALALGSGGTGILLLGLRVLAQNYALPVHPVSHATTAGLGLYFVIHALLLGAATEGSYLARQVGSVVSNLIWCAWAAWLAWCCMTSRSWSYPEWFTSLVRRGPAA